MVSFSTEIICRWKRLNNSEVKKKCTHLKHENFLKWSALSLDISLLLIPG